MEDYDEIEHLGDTVTLGLRDSFPRFGNPVLDTVMSGLLVLLSSWVTIRLSTLVQVKWISFFLIQVISLIFPSTPRKF